MHVSLVGTQYEIEAYNWTPKAIRVLAGVMRVIKCTSIRSGLESVCKTPTRRYRAHRNTWDTVRPFCVLLVETMPMHGGTFRWPVNSIVHGDLDGVSPIGFNQRLEIEPSVIELVRNMDYLPLDIGH